MRRLVLAIYNSLKKINAALKQGIRIGCLDGPSLQHATDSYYQRASLYQNDEYNLGGLHPWEVRAIRRYFTAGDRVLVAGAGGGREALALSQEGYSVTGFDCNEDLNRVAMRLALHQGLELKVVESDAGKVPPLNEYWGGVIVGWGAYMHISGSEHRIDFLKQLNTRMLPGSPVLLSFFTRRPSSPKFRLVFYTARLLRFLRGSKHKVELGDVLDGSFDHYFTENEICNELQAGGFRCVHFAERPYGHVVATKVGL